MAEPQTLTQIAGAPLTPSPLASSALLVIDLQNEYQSGSLKLDQLDRALSETKKLLALARANGVPVFHFQHKTGPGAPIFDPTGPYFGLIDAVKPVTGETVIEKNYPNCFTATGLAAIEALLQARNRVVGAALDGVEDGRELGPDQVEQEEVNILYVALTRARAAIRLNESFDDWLRHRRLLPG